MLQLRWAYLKQLVEAYQQQRQPQKYLNYPGLISGHWKPITKLELSSQQEHIEVIHACQSILPWQRSKNKATTSVATKNNRTTYDKWNEIDISWYSSVLLPQGLYAREYKGSGLKPIFQPAFAMRYHSLSHELVRGRFSPFVALWAIVTSCLRYG